MPAVAGLLIWIGVLSAGFSDEPVPAPTTDHVRRPGLPRPAGPDSQPVNVGLRWTGVAGPVVVPPVVPVVPPTSGTGTAPPVVGGWGGH